jgi:predicted acyltransferase
MSTPANKLQAKVIARLTKAGIFHWKQNTMPVWDNKLNSGYGAYRSHGGMKGVPDIICIIKGQFVGIEIKAGKDRISADQLLFKKRCERNGGLYLVVNDPKDVDVLCK